MKNLLFILSFLFLAGTASFAQFPNTTNQSNPITIFNLLGAVKGSKGVVIPNFPDTLTANLQPYIKGVDGLLMKAGSLLYMRDTTQNAWLTFLNTSSPGSKVDSVTVIADSSVYILWQGAGTITFPTLLKKVVAGVNMFITYRGDTIVLNSSASASNSGSGLLQGGFVTHNTGYTYDVTSAVYNIGTGLYSSASGSITLATADATFDRIDVIGLDTSGAIIKVTGVASANPQLPQVNPLSQLALTSILVKAGTTAPDNITRVIVYDENTEWSHTATLSPDFNNLVNPFHLVKAINIAAWNTSPVSAITFTSPTKLNISDYNVFKFFISLKAALPSNAYIFIALMNGTTYVTPYTPITTTFGLNSGTSAYQNISVPFTSLAITGTQFDRVQFYLYGPGPGMYLDYVQFQGGIPNGNSPYVTNVFRSPGTDSVYQRINGVNVFAFHDSTGGSSGGGSDTAFTANLLIYTNTLTPTGVLANAAAFRAGLTASGPGDNNDSVTINGYRIVDGSGAGQVGLIEISVSRLVVIPAEMFRNNSQITGFEDLGSLLSSGSEIRENAFRGSALQFFSAPFFGDIESSNLGDNAFAATHSLQKVYLPAWRASDNSVFSGSTVNSITVKTNGTSVSDIATANGFDPYILANVTSSGGNTIYTADDYIHGGNRIVYLDSNSLSIQNNGLNWLQIDPTTGNSTVLAYSPTDGSLSGFFNHAEDGQANSDFVSSYSNSTKVAVLSSFANASTATLTYTADTHTFTGAIINNADSSTSPFNVVTIDENNVFKRAALPQSGAAAKVHEIFTMGNSITANGGFQTELLTLLNDTSWKVSNFGVTGNATVDMRSRFAEVVKGKPEYVIVLGGINDIVRGYTSAVIDSNLSAMYKMAHDSGIYVVAVTTSPWKTYTSWTSGKQLIQDSVNSFILSNPAWVDEVVNIYPLLQDPGNLQALLPAYNSGDGLHPSTAGQNVIGQALFDSVAFTKNTSAATLSISRSFILDQDLRTVSSPAFQGLFTTYLDSMAIGGNTGQVYGINQSYFIPSTVNSVYTGFKTNLSTSAALTSLIHFSAAKTTLTGALTNQIGFYVDTSMNGATNNSAFRSDLTSGTGRFNLYMNGNAANYIAGNTGYGTTAPASLHHVYENTARTTIIGTGLAPSVVSNEAGTNNYAITDFISTLGSTVAKGRIGVITTASGSQMDFGVSNSYASGITHVPLRLGIAGNVYLPDSTTAKLIVGSAITNYRINMPIGTTTANGIGWGDSAVLYRSAANTLKINGAFSVAGNSTFTGGATFAGVPAFTYMTSGSIPYMGTGGALTQNNSTLFWNNSSGFMGVGTSSPQEVFHGLKDAVTGAYFRMDSYNGAAGFQTYALNGTVASPTATTSGQFIGLWSMRGFTTALTTSAAAYVAGKATQLWASGASGSQLVFATTTNSTVSAAVRMTIDQNGNVAIGTQTPTARLHLPAGTATAGTGEIKLTAGTLLTTPESGTIETNSGNEAFYSTSTTAASRGYFKVDRYASTATSLTVDGNNDVIDVTATGQTITLPTAVGRQGRTYTIKLTASGSCTVNTTSSQNIDASTTYSLSAQYKYVTVMSTNAAWIVIANN